MFVGDGVQRSVCSALQGRAFLYHIRTTLYAGRSAPTVYRVWSIPVAVSRLFACLVATWIVVDTRFSAEACRYYCGLSDIGAVTKTWASYL